MRRHSPLWVFSTMFRDSLDYGDLDDSDSASAYRIQGDPRHVDTRLYSTDVPRNLDVLARERPPPQFRHPVAGDVIDSDVDFSIPLRIETNQRLLSVDWIRPIVHAVFWQHARSERRGRRGRDHAESRTRSISTPHRPQHFCRIIRRAKVPRVHPSRNISDEQTQR